MNEAAILIIKDYMTEHLFEPCARWPEYYFAERSYARWVATEILERLEHSQASPINVIADFIRELDDYSCVNTHNELLFSMARDAAEEIIRLFL